MSDRVRRWTRSLLLVAAAALLLFATVVVLRSTRWSGPLGPEYVESHLSIGPIGPGESLEQGFCSPGSYLGAIKFDLNLEVSLASPVTVDLRLRERGSQSLIREGQAKLRPERGPYSRTWEFSPIARSSGLEYKLLFAISPDASAVASFSASLLNPLDGWIVPRNEGSAVHSSGSARLGGSTLEPTRSPTHR